MVKSARHQGRETFLLRRPNPPKARPRPPLPSRSKPKSNRTKAHLQQAQEGRRRRVLLQLRHHRQPSKVARKVVGGGDPVLDGLGVGRGGVGVVCVIRFISCSCV
jgi:hypothetical protein